MKLHNAVIRKTKFVFYVTIIFLAILCCLYHLLYSVLHMDRYSKTVTLYYMYYFTKMLNKVELKSK